MDLQLGRSLKKKVRQRSAAASEARRRRAHSFHHSKKLIMYGYGMNPYQQAAFGGYNRGT